MTALPPQIAEKCAKALGQLASRHEGQVMAGARGLLRILEGAGLGITDLSDHITAPPREIIRYIHKPQDPPRAVPRDYGDFRSSWRDLDPRRRNKARAAKVRAAPPGFLSEWEEEFVPSLGWQLDQGRNLTPRQETILRDIHVRYEERYG